MTRRHCTAQLLAATGSVWLVFILPLFPGAFIWWAGYILWNILPSQARNQTYLMSWRNPFIESSSSIGGGGGGSIAGRLSTSSSTVSMPACRICQLPAMEPNNPLISPCRYEFRGLKGGLMVAWTRLLPMQDDGTSQIWLVSGCVTLCTFWTSPSGRTSSMAFFYAKALNIFLCAFSDASAPSDTFITTVSW